MAWMVASLKPSRFLAQFRPAIWTGFMSWTTWAVVVDASQSWSAIWAGFTSSSSGSRAWGSITRL